MTSDAAIPAERAEQEALELADDPILRQMLDEERVAGSEIDTRMIARLAGYLRPHRKLSAVAVALAFLEAAVMTLPAYMIGLAVDAISGGAGRAPSGFDTWVLGWSERFVDAVPGPTAERVVLFFGLAVSGLWLARWSIAAVASYLVQKLGQHVVHDLRREVYEHITAMDQGFLQKNPVGRLVNRTTFDLQALSDLFSDAFAEGLRDAMFVVVLIAVMLSIDPVLAAILIASFPPLVLVALAYRAAARPALRTTSAVQSRMNSWLAENLAGMRENHLYRREARRRAEYRALTDAHQISVTRVIRAWGLLRPGMMLVSSITTVIVLWVGYQRAETGLVSVGVLLTFLQYTARLWVPVRSLTEKFNMIQTSLTSCERVTDLLDTPSAMTDAPDADAEQAVVHGEICFDDVWFSYPGKADDVLRGVEFRVAPGNMLALVGDTGAGKSTIAHLISRFYDARNGRVVVDGVDVRRYTLLGLRRGMALVPQDVVVFAGSLRDNVTLGADVSDEDILACLRAVSADEIVSRFDDGLDHMLEEGGRTLSVGERQLLSFARALAINPPILILDEATANVDTETELRIQQALARVTAGRTSVVIAHRLSTIRRADEILVLRHGRIVERGRHDALLTLDGEYARLYRLHMGGASG